MGLVVYSERNNIGRTRTTGMDIAIVRDFSAPHRLSGAEGAEGRPHHHPYILKVGLPGEPDDEQLDNVNAALDLAIASTKTAEWSEGYTVINAAWWFREHLLFVYPNVTIELTRVDEMGATVVGVP
jgi:6-pyruvoyl-tetrahydropterin synthase